MLTSGIAAMSYYAIFFPLITTIAHFSAGISLLKPLIFLCHVNPIESQGFIVVTKLLNSVLVGTILGSVLLATENMKICQEKKG